MRDSINAFALLRRAAELYDNPATGLREASLSSWQRGFASGASWMRTALAHLRGEPPPLLQGNFNRLGATKYALSSLAASSCLVMGVMLKSVWPAVLAPMVFYLVEAQMLFVFPLAIDGSTHPLRASAAWTHHAGGTLRATRIAILLAATMLLGGFAGRGFLRCWCIGCLAVCVWYQAIIERGAEA